MQRKIKPPKPPQRHTERPSRLPPRRPHQLRNGCCRTQQDNCLLLFAGVPAKIHFYTTFFTANTKPIRNHYEIRNRLNDCFQHNPSFSETYQIFANYLSRTDLVSANRAQPKQPCTANSKRARHFCHAHLPFMYLAPPYCCCGITTLKNLALPSALTFMPTMPS